MNILSLQDVHIGYGGIKAVKGITFNVAEHELVCLIGANGAGKSTTLKAISGLLTPTAGTIKYNDEDISGQAAYKIAGKGLRLVPEGRGVFPILTIEENLLMGAYTRNDKAGIAHDIERMFAVPEAQRAPQSNRRHTFRWRTADAGDWSRTYGAAKAAVAR